MTLHRVGCGCRARAWAAVFLVAVTASPAWSAPLRVAVISDLNGSYGSAHYSQAVHDSVAALVGRRPDLVISTGDMVSGQQLQPLLANHELAAMWGAFHDAVTTPLGRAGIPFAVTPGNHDASAYPQFERERSRFEREWAERRPAVQFVDEGHYPFYYAFALGDVLFASLDVTRTGRLAPSQRHWLDDLLERSGPRFRHRVVFSHLPVYPFTRGRETEISGDLKLEQILIRHHVELYLSGHHHAFYPGFHSGIRYVSQACLGAGPRALIGTDKRSVAAVTWLEFEPDEVRVAALTGRQLEGQIALASLPRSIQSGSVVLVRDDLRPHPAIPVPAEEHVDQTETVQ